MKAQRPNSNTLKAQTKKVEKESLIKDMLRRENWFKDEQNNILKHSELDHIFQNKLNKVYDLDEIKTNTLPKPSIELENTYALRNQKQNNQFIIKQRSKASLEAKQIEKNNSISNIENARMRR